MKKAQLQNQYGGGRNKTPRSYQPIHISSQATSRTQDQKELYRVKLSFYSIVKCLDEVFYIGI